jgi:hypothetical protein
MFEVDKIDLENNRPDRITLSVPVDFLAHLTKMIGSMRPMDFPDPSFRDFYSTMVSTVLNPFWENGVIGAVDGDEQ